MRVKETQPVHILSTETETETEKKIKINSLNLLGTVKHKLNPKLELEASKAEIIRQRSQDAEKERLSRKTVELDSMPLGNSKGQKKLIKRKPGVNVNVNVTVKGNGNGNGNVKNLVKSKSENGVSSTSIKNYSLRTRLIQILAIGPITKDQLIKKLNYTLTNIIMKILSELCDNNNNTDDELLLLRSEFYSEVKLTDWPFYTMREREQVYRNISAFIPPISNQSNQSSQTNHTRTSQTSSIMTPPETPETPSPKKQQKQQILATSTSTATSIKKSVTAKDRLNAIMKRRR